MQLSEIKNDLAIINYSPAVNRLLLSDFILIEDSNQSILAQIISIEATMEDDVNSAMLKFLLSIDKDANLTQYSGYVPAKNASLILINPEEVVQLIKGNDKNIHIGNLAAYKDIPVELSLDFLRKRTYVQVDFVENKLQIVETIIRGLEKNNKKTLLFDFQGLYERISLPTVKLGYNFKLPLNYDALCYIAEEELNDFGNDNKAIIQGILIEVQNYVKTMEDDFIPLETLISVLDAQYEESPMPELLLLKNKLLKYQQQGLFAQEKSEFDFLDTFLKDAKNFKFDLSELPIQWHKIAFASILNIIKTKCYLITDFSDDNSNKTIIKKLYEKSEIKPIVISSYDYKYQLQLKAMSKNLILFKPEQKVNDFAGYTSFLNILSQDTFIVWGEHTLFIPLILKIQSKNVIEAKLENKLLKENNAEEETKSEITEEQVTLDDIVSDAIPDEPIEEVLVSDDIPSEQDVINEEFISDDIIDDDIVEEEIVDDEVDDDELEIAQDIIEEEVLENDSLPKEDEIEIESDASQSKNFDIDENLLTDDDNIDNCEPERTDDYQQNLEDIDYIVESTVDDNENSNNIEESNIEQTEDVESLQTQISNDVPTEDDIDFFFNDEEEQKDVVNEDFDADEDFNITDTDNSINAPEEESQVSEEDIVDNFETSLINDEFQHMDTSSDENETILEETNIDEAELTTEDVVEDFDNIEFDDNLEETTQITTEEKTEISENEEMPVQNNIEESINSFAEDDEFQNAETEDEPENEEEIVIPDTPAVEIKQAQIPVYNTNSAPQFDTKFAQGTYVYHQKYGRGVVEKVLTYNGKHGSKELCYIIFDSVGRRCLDPNLADIKQI